MQFAGIKIAIKTNPARTRIATGTVVRTRAPAVIRIGIVRKIRNDRRIRTGQRIKIATRTRNDPRTKIARKIKNATKTRTGRGKIVIKTRKSPVAAAAKIRIVISTKAARPHHIGTRIGTARKTSTRAVAAVAKIKTNIPAVAAAKIKIARIATVVTSTLRPPPPKIKIVTRKTK